MEPPLCRTCGKKHWSRVCEETSTVTVTKPVSATVTPNVTPKLSAIETPRMVAPSKLAALETENEALRAEVAMLKGRLADVNKLPMTGAERVRRHREKQKGSS